MPKERGELEEERMASRGDHGPSPGGGGEKEKLSSTQSSMDRLPAEIQKLKSQLAAPSADPSKKGGGVGAREGE